MCLIGLISGVLLVNDSMLNVKGAEAGTHLTHLSAAAFGGWAAFADYGFCWGFIEDGGVFVVESF